MHWFRVLRHKWRMYKLEKELDRMEIMRSKCEVGTLQRTILDRVIPATRDMVSTMKNAKIK